MRISIALACIFGVNHSNPSLKENFSTPLIHPLSNTNFFGKKVRKFCKRLFLSPDVNTPTESSGMFQNLLHSMVATGCLLAGTVWACGSSAPVKMVVKGEVMSAQGVADYLKQRLPCRDDTAVLSCMCRPLAGAMIEVTVGFRWNGAQMSQVSERRLKELGDGLRKIEGFGGASVKLIPAKSHEYVLAATALQRKSGVANMVALAAQPNVDGDTQAVKPFSMLNRSKPKARWVREKFLINAVFV